MRLRRAIVPWIALCACAHTHTTPSQKQQSKQNPPAEVVPPSQPGQPKLSSSPKGLLNPGAVQEIQKALRSKGYHVPIDGSLKGETAKALQDFQRKAHLPTTGLPDRETLRKLGLDPDKLYRSNPK